ncbi:hypothetical protein MTO96_035249 [Rhipicephalus appendiculatus]
MFLQERSPPAREPYFRRPPFSSTSAAGRGSRRTHAHARRGVPGCVVSCSCFASSAPRGGEGKPSEGFVVVGQRRRFGAGSRFVVAAGFALCRLSWISPSAGRGVRPTASQIANDMGRRNVVHSASPARMDAAGTELRYPATREQQHLSQQRTLSIISALGRLRRQPGCCQAGWAYAHCFQSRLYYVCA